MLDEFIVVPNACPKIKVPSYNVPQCGSAAHRGKTPGLQVNAVAQKNTRACRQIKGCRQSRISRQGRKEEEEASAAGMKKIPIIKRWAKSDESKKGKKKKEKSRRPRSMSFFFFLSLRVRETPDPLCTTFIIDSNFKQQRLRACQPLLTPIPVITTFLVIGLVFVPLGSIMVVSSDRVRVAFSLFFPFLLVFVRFIDDLRNLLEKRWWRWRRDMITHVRWGLAAT